MLLFIDFSFKMMHSLWTNIFAVFLKYRLQDTNFRYCCFAKKKKNPPQSDFVGPSSPRTLQKAQTPSHANYSCAGEKTLIIPVSSVCLSSYKSRMKTGA